MAEAASRSMGQRRMTPLDTLLRPAIAEFVGAFTLILVGVGAIVVARVTIEEAGGAPVNADLVAIAFAHGLAIGVMIAAAGHISGGHFNPAVSLAMLITGRIDAAKFAVYIVAQLLGAVVAALVVTWIFPEGARDAARMGIPQVGAAFTPGQAFVAEVVATFFLVYVIFGSAVDGRGLRAIAPLAIGLTVSMDIFWAGGISGAAMNPARAFGPALVDNFWSDQWIYWAGPAIGAAIAGILHWFILQNAGRIGIEVEEGL